MSATTPQTKARAPLVGTQIGRVVSAKRDKTRKVEVRYQIKSPKYGKYINRRTAYQVHDPQNTSRDGDIVEIAPCRPISKTKSWRLVRVVTAAPTGDEPAGGDA